MFVIKVNGEEHHVDVPGDTPMLWVLREELGLTGTKFGCGMAVCGACTIHVNGEAKRSCTLPIAMISDAQVETIDGLSKHGLHAIQEAWIEENVPQCGYCQSGQIMSAVAMLRTVQNPTDAQIDAVMSANICRCGTYPRIRRAIKSAVQKLQTKAQNAQSPKGPGI